MNDKNNIKKHIDDRNNIQKYIDANSNPDFTKRDALNMYLSNTSEVLEKKKVIFIIIENSEKSKVYKNELQRIITKLVESNREELFCLIKIGKGSKNFGVCDYMKIKNTRIIEGLFSDFDFRGNISFSSAISFIHETIKELERNSFVFKYEQKKFKIAKGDFVVIGTDALTISREQKVHIRNAIKEIKNSTFMKSIKYFCIHDSEVVLAASLGFPLIGHIVTDFYA